MPFFLEFCIKSDPACLLLPFCEQRKRLFPTHLIRVIIRETAFKTLGTLEKRSEDHLINSALAR